MFNSSLHPVIGLSAPQLGYSLQIIAFQIKDKQLIKEQKLKHDIPLTFLINPKIEVLKMAETEEFEFCESLPDYSALVRRPSMIKVEAIGIDGQHLSQIFNGLVSRIIQHEVDHLNGILYTDKMVSKSLRHDCYVGKFGYNSLIK